MSLPTEMPLAQRREFLNNYDKLVAMFGAELVDEGLMRYSVRELVDEYQVPLEDAYNRPIGARLPYQKPCILLARKRGHHRFINAQGWEKSVSVPMETYMVPAQYQGNVQAQHILKPAMHTLFPWLRGFRLDIYKLDFYQNWPGEFYVKLGTHYWKGGFDSLYVPFDAFAAGDVNAIIKRNQTYFDDYTKDKTVWQRISLDPVVITFLDKVKENKR